MRSEDRYYRDASQLTRRNLARTLLVKRPAFKHEREVRLIFTPHDFHNFTNDLLRYPVEHNSLIDQIMLDPRMDKAEAGALKHRIRAAGFTGEIKRSLLYAPPPDLRIPLEPTNQTPDSRPSWRFAARRSTTRVVRHRVSTRSI